jgi:hypothetical protein
MMDKLIIQGQEFGPGSYGMIRINAGRLPSGNRISIFAYVFRVKSGTCGAVYGRNARG